MVELNAQNPNLKGSDLRVLVEARGIEPLSENRSAGFSPGADDPLHSLAAAPVVRLYRLVAS